MKIIIDSYTIIIILTIILIIIIIVSITNINNKYLLDNDSIKYKHNTYKKTEDIPKTPDIMISKQNNNHIIIDDDNESIYEEKINNKLEPPGIYHQTEMLIPPKYTVVYNPVNIRTRGMPTEYQQLGYLTNINDSNNVKPLYGRQTYSGSKNWNYYSSTDTHLSIKIPVYNMKNKCTDERGCNELNEGDKVLIGDNNNSIYIVSLYSMEGYRYIPDII